MKSATKVIVALAAVALLGLAAHGQEPADLVGTWSGQATLEGIIQPGDLVPLSGIFINIHFLNCG